MEIAVLKKIGLTDKEIKVYITLLEYGAISVRSLAEIAKMNRGTTYDILKKLQDLNLVSYYHQETKQKFVAEDPEKILKIIQNKEEELDKVKKTFDNLIPELKAMQEKGENKPTVKFYEGKSGIHSILNDVLETMKEVGRNPSTSSGSREYYVYSTSGITKDLYEGYKDFSKKRIKDEIRVKTISLTPGGETRGLDERKWISKTKFTKIKKTYTMIYEDKCAFVSRDATEKPVGVIIENKMIYETQKIIFLQLWDMLK